MYYILCGVILFLDNDHGQLSTNAKIFSIFFSLLIFALTLGFAFVNDKELFIDFKPARNDVFSSIFELKVR